MQRRRRRTRLWVSSMSIPRSAAAGEHRVSYCSARCVCTGCPSNLFTYDDYLKIDVIMLLLPKSCHSWQILVGRYHRTSERQRVPKHIFLNSPDRGR